VQVRTYTPWKLWTFSQPLPGSRSSTTAFTISTSSGPGSVIPQASTQKQCATRNPQRSQPPNPRSCWITASGSGVFIVTNHGHDFSSETHRSFVQWEGTGGAIRMDMGVNLDYPKGVPDTLAYVDAASQAANGKSFH